MAHHVDGVHLLHAARLRVDLGFGDFLHHFGGDLIGALRPGVHDEVVLFLVRGQAVQILLLILAHAMACLVDQLILVSGTTMSSLPNEMPALQASRKPRPITASANSTVSF